ncbi:hypothetical protein [Amycolatopsis panacis]|uniref:Uncharacterized protein n=1 Tax=Amycolatopsis panacis TaxID=2340917 RepID=A0A419IC16_9PSEU|nr:hypothetical protein [Amycolatopsis panacis]RJQ92379.1 hypothetical protein D5S19_01040 [Amycolatopsis panacis]
MSAEDTDPGARITLSRSAVLELCREARAYGYAWGRLDEHCDAVARRTREPVDQGVFVERVMAGREDVLRRLWREMQDHRDSEGGHTR